MGESVVKSKCEKCGYDDPRALHRHHIRDENNKAIGVVTLCANCHYILHSNPYIFKDFEKEEVENTRNALAIQLKLINSIVARLTELGAKCDVYIDPQVISEIYGDHQIVTNIWGDELKSDKSLETEGWERILKDIEYKLMDSGYYSDMSSSYNYKSGELEHLFWKTSVNKDTRKSIIEEDHKYRSVEEREYWRTQFGPFTKEEHALYMRFLDKVRKDMIKEKGFVYPQNTLTPKWRQRFEKWKKGEVSG